MQKVLTAAQMREVDRLTTERYGIPSLILMENAAHAVTRVITEKLGGSVNGKSILILCGKGNNGGDGAAVARILSSEGANIRLILFAKIDQTKGDAKINFERLPSKIEVCEAEEWWQAWEYINPRDWDELECVVDAVFGTGLKYPRDDINEIVGSFSNVFHVAVDIPSALMADQAAVQLYQYRRADVTVSFTAPKIANVLPPASNFNGDLVVTNIGSPQELIDEQASRLYVAEKNDAAAWVKRSAFASDSYKNKRGHALLIAGSKNYTGAAVLAADAAMRSGVGLVTLAVPESLRESVGARVMPEVMVRGVSDSARGSASEKAVDEVKEFLRNVDAIAIGSGLSTNDETATFVRRMVDERTMPMVIDADGLTALSPFNMEGSDELPLILTPHEGEFMRLLGTEDKDAIKDRVASVRDFATKHRVILVLKGERVLIGEPGGKVVVNPTGNSGLGKAGNGDTLAGILIGFVAQAVQMKIGIFETVVAACYVAGMAGDVAEKKYGKRVMTASDVRECLTEVFESLEAN